MEQQFYAMLADNIRTRRRSLNLTQADLASAADISRVTLSNIEGMKQKPSVYQLVQLVKSLGIPDIDELIPTRSKERIMSSDHLDPCTQFRVEDIRQKLISTSD